MASVILEYFPERTEPMVDDLGFQRHLPTAKGRHVKLAWLILWGILGGCIFRTSTSHPLEPAVIRISGSDTMLLLTRLWAEEYMKLKAGVSLYVQGGGSAHGIRELIRSQIDVCAASRPLQPKEVQQLARRHNTVGLTVAVAKEALSVYIHPLNPVKDLSLAQLKDIFNGATRNWKELGGRNESILVLTRSPSSGTYLYFQEHILNEEPYLPSARVMSTTQSVVEMVEKNRNAIGYGGVAYGRNLHCKIEGIAPTHENIITGKYPITRYLYLVTVNTPKGHIKDFIDWVLGPVGQDCVASAGYVPLWSPDR